MGAVAASSGSMRSSILPPWKPGPRDPSASYAVNRSSISKPVPARPPRFIEPITTLPSRAPSSSRSSRMSAVPSTPSTPGRASAIISRREQLAAVGHRQRVVAGSQRTACRVVGGDQHQPAGLPHQRGRAGRAAAQLGDPARRVDTRRDQVGHDVGAHETTVASSASSSAVVGMASAQASCPATYAPAALAKRRIRSSVPAREQPVAERAAEGVPGAEAVDDVDGDGRHDDRLVAASAQHARRALLDDRQARRRRRAARRRPRSGSRSPTATSHSSRLPTATST